MAIMSIALTNLGKYNEGVLDFVWLDLPATDDEIAAAFDKIEVSHDDVHYYSDGEGHTTTGSDLYGEYEEWFITDYECDFYQIGEYESLDKLNEMADAIESSGDPEMLRAILDNVTSDLDEAIRDLDRVITYPNCDDMEDVARYCVDEEFIQIPDHLIDYFDFEAYGRDLEMDGMWFEYDGGMALIPY